MMLLITQGHPHIIMEILGPEAELQQTENDHKQRILD